MPPGHLFRQDGKGIDALTLVCATGAVTFLPSAITPLAPWIAADGLSYQGSSSGGRASRRDKVAWKRPITGCMAGVRDKGETYSSKTLFKVTKRHIETMHPRVSAKAYRIEQIKAHKAAPARRQSRRVENLNASAAASLAELAKLGLTHFLIPVVRRARTTKKDKLVLSCHWLCTKCNVLGEGTSRAPKHECAKATRASNMQRHLTALEKTEQWCEKHPAMVSRRTFLTGSSRRLGGFCAGLLQGLRECSLRSALPHSPLRYLERGALGPLGPHEVTGDFLLDFGP